MFASISFFEKTGENLKQLFRAEWDNYPQDGTSTHPQPHWHFTKHLNDMKKTFSNLETEENGLFRTLQDNNEKTTNIEQMHFAMLGNWIRNGNMVNMAENVDVLIDWMDYLFAHIQNELTYIHKRRE